MLLLLLPLPAADERSINARSGRVWVCSSSQSNYQHRLLHIIQPPLPPSCTLHAGGIPTISLLHIIL